MSRRLAALATMAAMISPVLAHNPDPGFVPKPVPARAASSPAAPASPVAETKPANKGDGKADIGKPDPKQPKADPKP